MLSRHERVVLYRAWSVWASPGGLGERTRESQAAMCPQLRRLVDGCRRARDRQRPGSSAVDQQSDAFDAGFVAVAALISAAGSITPATRFETMPEKLNVRALPAPAGKTKTPTGVGARQADGAASATSALLSDVAPLSAEAKNRSLRR